MIAINVWVQGMFITVTSVFTPQSGLDDSQKYHFYDILRRIVSKLIKGQDYVEDYENWHVDYDLRVLNKEVKSGLEF